MSRHGGHLHTSSTRHLAEDVWIRPKLSFYSFAATHSNIFASWFTSISLPYVHLPRGRQHLSHTNLPRATEMPLDPFGTACGTRPVNGSHRSLAQYPARSKWCDLTYSTPSANAHPKDLNACTRTASPLSTRFLRSACARARRVWAGAVIKQRVYIVDERIEHHVWLEKPSAARAGHKGARGGRGAAHKGT